MGLSSLSEAHSLVGDLSVGIGSARGEALYRFLERERPVRCLELGFAHGVSTVYAATALEANGTGTLSSVDNLSAHDRVPSAAELLAKAGLEHRVELTFEPTSYNWFLHRQIRAQSTAGVCEPYLDFCFIDGAHTWADDGLAFFLVDKLLKPGGWILFDDLQWRMDERWPHVPESERKLAQVGEVFELLVAQHPAYDQIESDGDWGWARKALSTTPEARIEVRRGFLEEARALVRHLRSRRTRKRV